MTMRSKKKPFGNCQAFTLLEVMVAIVILGVALMTLFELFSGSIKLAVSSEDYIRATLLAQKKMNDLKLVNFVLEEGEDSGVFEDYPDYNWSLEMKPYQTEYTRDKEKESFKEVKLTVSWKGRGRKKKKFELVRLHNPITWSYPGIADQVAKAAADPFSDSKGTGKSAKK